MKRIIVCAAIRRPSDGMIICGPRHGHCLNKIAVYGLSEPKERWECGFVDQDNVFMTRAEAWVIANENLQIRRPTGYSHEELSVQTKPIESTLNEVHLLFSENLY